MKPADFEEHFRLKDRMTVLLAKGVISGLLTSLLGGGALAWHPLAWPWVASAVITAGYWLRFWLTMRRLERMDRIELPPTRRKR